MGKSSRTTSAHRRIECRIRPAGTLFGSKTNGRVESILMSLPPTVRFKYDWHAEPGGPEAALTEYWLKPQMWADMEN